MDFSNSFPFVGRHVHTQKLFAIVFEFEFEFEFPTGTDSVPVPDFGAQTLLILAASGGHERVVTMLLHAKATLDKCDRVRARVRHSTKNNININVVSFHCKTHAQFNAFEFPCGVHSSCLFVCGFSSLIP